MAEKSHTRLALHCVQPLTMSYTRLALRCAQPLTMSYTRLALRCAQPLTRMGATHTLTYSQLASSN